MHGKPAGRVTLVKKGLCKMKVILSLLLAAVTCMDLGEFLLGFIQIPSGTGCTLFPLKATSPTSGSFQKKNKSIFGIFPYVQDGVGVIGIVRSGSSGSVTRLSVIKPCHFFYVNSHSHFFHVRAQSHSLFFFLNVIFNFLYLFF